jgi:hypothetical protein
LAVLLLVIGAGCQQASGTEASAKNLDSELSGFDNVSNDIDSMNIDDLDDSELDSLNGLL